jgi:hypothetical protein
LNDLNDVTGVVPVTHTARTMSTPSPGCPPTPAEAYLLAVAQATAIYTAVVVQAGRAYKDALEAGTPRAPCPRTLLPTLDTPSPRSPTRQGGSLPRCASNPVTPPGAVVREDDVSECAILTKRAEVGKATFSAKKGKRSRRKKCQDVFMTDSSDSGWTPANASSIPSLMLAGSTRRSSRARQRRGRPSATHGDPT